MKRRGFLSAGVAGGGLVFASIIPGVIPSMAEFTGGHSSIITGAAESTKLRAPGKGKIPVAFPISSGVTVIDFAGPWEVFSNVIIKERGEAMSEQMPFELFTVAENLETITGAGGLKLIPNYTFETLPQPKVVVIPAQTGSPELSRWLRKITPQTDVTMSVCTGAFQLAKAGLLSGKSATTHHDFTDSLAKKYPDINVRRGVRFVEGEKISTAGGLTSGIDLALRVVERYFERKVAQATATYMEYQGQGWVV